MMEYQVELVNLFEADSPEDAVRQFIGWALDNAQDAGYRVFAYDGSLDNTGVFIEGCDVYA
jgi:hypothetical protein